MNPDPSISLENSSTSLTSAGERDRMDEDAENSQGRHEVRLAGGLASDTRNAERQFISPGAVNRYLEYQKVDTCHLPTTYIYLELATHHIDNRNRMAQWSLRALRDAKPDDKTPEFNPPPPRK
jgi:hypothetical protein